MTTYNFTVFPDTSAIAYYDMQYFTPNLYCISSSSPHLVEISTAGAITSLSYSTLLANSRCLAVINASNFYCGTINGTIYLVTYGIPSIIANISVELLRSMTLNADNTILYIAGSTTIYTMNTASPTTPSVFSTGYNNLSCIRFVNNALYVNNYGAQQLLTLNSDGSTIRTLTTTPTQTSGTAIDIYEDWYVSNQINNSGFSSVNIDDTLTDKTTNLQPINSSNFHNIVFDGDDYAYFLVWDTKPGIYKSNSAFCFNERTKILCMNHNLQDEYIRIELLKIGDFVKTYKHGYRKVSKVITGKLRNNPKKWNMCMYKMVKTPSNGLLEDLIVTGGHSILVDEISDAEQAKYDEMGLTEFSKTSIDNKRLLLSSVSDQFTPMQDNETYTYYHLLLENNDDDEERFGIYANGILTETPNVKTVKN